ncbi:hypothetical protein [Prevotella pectinovora]|uniref:hypothetical protein n=1 Tax=Prevotella pectinovora TaxID=1602169 RepID=UPI00307D63FF
MKKRMIPLLQLLSSHFLLAVYGRDSQKEQSCVVVIAIDGLRWQEVFELIGHTSDIKSAHPGQARCPCWASTLPQLGKQRAHFNPNRSLGLAWILLF